MILQRVWLFFLLSHGQPEIDSSRSNSEASRMLTRVIKFKPFDILIVVVATLLGVFSTTAQATEEPPPLSEQPIADTVFALTNCCPAEFQHPETGVFYGSQLAGRDSWTSPEEVLQEKPKPWGYGSRIADTVLHTGHLLVALLVALLDAC